MKTTNVNLYKFSELSKEAKKKAIEKEIQYRSENYDLNFEVECLEEGLTEKGYNNPEIQYSGFYSQGDGASFTASIDFDKWLELQSEQVKAKYQPIMETLNKEQVEFNISINRFASCYVHENTCRVEIDCYDLQQTESARPELIKLINELEGLIEDQRKDDCKEIYKKLEVAWDSYMDEKEIAEYLSDNDDCIYTELGNIY